MCNPNPRSPSPLNLSEVTITRVPHNLLLRGDHPNLKMNAPKIWAEILAFHQFRESFQELGFSGQVRPRQGAEICNSGRRLHWRLSTGLFAFSPVFMCNLVRRAPLKCGESSEKSSAENRVKSCHVCGCHGFFGPEFSHALRS